MFPVYLRSHNVFPSLYNGLPDTNLLPDGIRMQFEEAKGSIGWNNVLGP